MDCTRDEESAAGAHPVIIIGAGPAGLATAACLSVRSIPYLILEREDCIASLWRHRTYNRLKLHLAKRFCQLPHMPHPADSPTYMPRDRFIRYLDEYAAKFDVLPEFGSAVESAVFREGDGKWVVKVRRVENGEEREYVGRYLVAATGENAEPNVPKIEGIEGFAGELIHSADYKNGTKYKGKRVLVVGSGNSGMEIAYDLSSHGAVTSICVRGEVQVMSKEMINFGMHLLKYNMPLPIVDSFLILLSNIKYGDLSKFGINKPKDGPFFLKATVGRSPVIDVGTIHKIKKGEIQVLPGISFIDGDWVKFTNGESHYFDTILFATGYKSLANKWLKDEKNFLNERGLPARKFPNHWKGENGIYSAGLSRRGLEGIASDARLISNDIDRILKSKRSKTKPSYEAYREAKTVFPSEVELG